MENMVLDSLLEIAHTLGQDVSLIQGGGGNISIKTDDGRMYIKASGTTLGQMSEQRGYAVVDLTGQVLDPERQQRPSMEMPMHLILPRCVIHTHSVYANIYNCMVGGDAILLDWFEADRPIYIPYTHPGAALAQAIERATVQHVAQYQQTPTLFFLENHGLITCDTNPSTALALTLRIHAQLQHNLQEQWPDFKAFAARSNAIQPQECFFPDAAVFVQSKPTAGVMEIWSANDYIASTIAALGGQTRHLTAQHIQDLQQMESEQYRLRQ